MAKKQSMNKELVRKSFARGLATYHQHAKAQQQICSELAEMIRNYTTKEPKQILEIGCGSGFLSQELFQTYLQSHFFMNDLVAEAEAAIRLFIDPAGQQQVDFMAGDAESLDFPSNLDLIASASTVQWFHHLDVFFERMAERLNHSGILAFSTFGEDNFKEITALTQQGISYPSVERISENLNPFYSILEKREKKIVLYFDHPIDVLKHIRHTGVKGHLGQKWTKGGLDRFVKEYIERFSIDQKVSLTYHPLYFVCQKK